MSINGHSNRIEWLIAKYVADLHRQEPRNVGVVVKAGDSFLTRFLGERADGQIDGRRVRWPSSLANYRAWVDYWRYAVNQEGADLGNLTKRLGDENYYLEYGGERLFGSEDTDPNYMLDYLYSVLVEETLEEPEPLDVVQLSETVLTRARIANRVTRRYSLDIILPNGVMDPVFFDYKYENGAIHLMKRVSLTHEDKRSWGNVHAAAWTFEKVAADSRTGGSQLIALVNTRQPAPELENQVGVLDNLAHVVDVGKVDQAASELSELLHSGDSSTLIG